MEPSSAIITVPVRLPQPKKPLPYPPVLSSDTVTADSRSVLPAPASWVCTAYSTGAVTTNEARLSEPPLLIEILPPRPT